MRDAILYSVPNALLLVTNYEESHTFRQSNHGYGGVTASSPQLDGSGPFPPPSSRPTLQAPEMAPYPDPRVYPAQSLPPGTSAYSEPPMYTNHPSHTGRQPSQVYPPQPDYYATPQSYGHDPAAHNMRSSPQYSGPQYGAVQYGQAPPRDRDPRDDPRYQPDYPDPSARYTYPSVTAAPNGGLASSPSQPARLAHGPRFLAPRC